MNQVHTALSAPHPVRLNPAESKLLRDIAESLTADQLESLIADDRAGRDGWRNYSGRPPKPTALILRRALMHGLPIVAEEVANTPDS
jgi:hypothetical protein